MKISEAQTKRHRDKKVSKITRCGDSTIRHSWGV